MLNSETRDTVYQLGNIDANQLSSPCHMPLLDVTLAGCDSGWVWLCLGCDSGLMWLWLRVTLPWMWLRLHATLTWMWLGCMQLWLDVTLSGCDSDWMWLNTKPSNRVVVLKLYVVGQRYVMSGIHFHDDRYCLLLNNKYKSQKQSDISFFLIGIFNK